ncbi:Acyltransferase ChoActase/COT/CPT [Trinorchestia longiramus]|nr:Acyltransferase ChoActase/COT/CPT [Trinorchestia longiramus]
MGPENKGSSKSFPMIEYEGEESLISKLKDVVSIDPRVTTFMYDETLPRLPVPPLPQTMERYLRSCAPLLDEEELQATEKVVKEFMAGDGPVLQSKLLQRAKEHKNWLEDWWMEHAYLNFREPLIPYLNIGGPQTLHLTKWPPSHSSAISYVSMFVYSSLIFHQLLREECLQPQTSVKGNHLSMEQFRRLFNTCRVPGQPSDALRSWWKTRREGDCPDHLIVLCNGHIWCFCPYDSRGEVTVAELEAQFTSIRDQSDSMGSGPGVASLTSESRDIWAKNCEWLRALSANNAKTLELIESAMFVVVLDNAEPANMNEVFWESVCGDTSNRWADKSFSIVVTRNGYALSNNDHTPYDAMVLVVLTHFGQRLNEAVDLRAVGRAGVRPFLPPPKLLKLDLDPCIISAISSARQKSKKLNSNIEVSFKQYYGFGKNWMKEKKVHPDALVQMTLQLTYYRTYGRMAPTYETATTRQFYHGRTETVKSCTSAAKTFAITMQDPTASLQDKVKALRTACSGHEELMRQCKGAQGIDRHLFGLYLTALENGFDVPAIFTDSAFAKTGGGGNYVLSTSTLGYTDCAGGVAPMVPHGYGVFYTMMPTWIYIMVSTFKDGGSVPAPEFMAIFTSCLDDVRTLLDDPISSSKL